MAIRIDSEKCLGCGCCIDVCSAGALEINDIAVVSEDDCTECGSCIEMCPADALS